MLVADVDWHQGDGTITAAQHRLNGHRQGTGFRIQQASGTRAAALNEVFDGVAAAEQLAEVFAEYRRIELIAFERTANEESAAATENRPGRPEIQVDTGSDMRRNQALMINHVREQQIIHMAAVARDINDLVAFVRQLAHALGVMHVNALIQTVPGKAQHAVCQANHLVGEVRGDLFHQGDSVLLRLFMRNFLAARFVFYRTGNGFRRQQFIEQILARRQARTDRRQTLTGEVHTRHAGQLLSDSFIGAVFVRHFTQRDRRRETHKAVAAQPQNGEEFLNAVEHAQWRVNLAFFTPRRATEHHRDWHHLHIKIGMITVQIQIVVKELDRLFFRRVIGEYARSAVDKYVARKQGAVDLQRLQRVR